MSHHRVPVNDPEALTPEQHKALFGSQTLRTKYGGRVYTEGELRAGDVRVRCFSTPARGAKYLALWWNPETEERGGFWYENWEEVEARFPGIAEHEGKKRKK